AHTGKYSPKLHHRLQYADSVLPPKNLHRVATKDGLNPQKKTSTSYARYAVNRSIGDAPESSKVSRVFLSCFVEGPADALRSGVRQTGRLPPPPTTCSCCRRTIVFHAVENNQQFYPIDM
ncbi:unnamed protein product, partial [Ectocarpus sp. 4 AP-2014]